VQKTGLWRWDSSKLTALLAMFTSVCALFVSVYQVQIERRHQYASVWPNLYIYTTTHTHTDSEQNMSAFVVTNKGIGPAIVEQVQIWYKGQLCEDESDLVSRLFARQATTGGEINQIWQNRVIAANEQFNWIGVTGSTSTTHFQRAFKNGDIKIKIRFASVYEEKWEANFGTDQPVVQKLE
jgi:hypothetical protein